EPADVPGVGLEERGLGPRLVILRLLADLLEQLAPCRIVEIAAVEPPWMVGEAAYYRLREAYRGVVERVDVEDEPGMALAAEAGQRVPLRHVPPRVIRSELLRQPRPRGSRTEVCAGDPIPQAQLPSATCLRGVAHWGQWTRSDVPSSSFSGPLQRSQRWSRWSGRTSARSTTHTSWHAGQRARPPH